MRKFNFTRSRVFVLEMLAQGPRSFAGAHWHWIEELHFLRTCGMVTTGDGRLWRMTRRGRAIFKTRYPNLTVWLLEESEQ